LGIADAGTAMPLHNAAMILIARVFINPHSPDDGLISPTLASIQI
jgi:hypothetical protein